MSLLTASIVVSFINSFINSFNSRISAVIYIIFINKVLEQTWKTLNTKFGPQWKVRESSYQIRQILTLFCKLVALSLA